MLTFLCLAMHAGGPSAPQHMRQGSEEPGVRRGMGKQTGGRVGKMLRAGQGESGVGINRPSEEPGVAGAQ